MLWGFPILAIINTAGSLQFSAGFRVGSFHLWTGDAGYEEAEFIFELNWDFRESD
jgi:hypothetical protein